VFDPLQVVLASAAVMLRPLLHEPPPMHVTSAVLPATLNGPVHVFDPMQSTEHSPVARHAMAPVQEPPFTHRIAQFFASHVTPLLQLLLPMQSSLHVPASQKTPDVHEPPFLQVTAQDEPLHVTGFVVQEFVPSQSMLQLAAAEQSTPFAHAPPPHVTEQGTPGGHRTVSVEHELVVLQSWTHVPASQLPPASGQP